MGICLDNNEQCYHPCRETIDTNPWAGCAPGWDCPWFPSPDESRCLSQVHQPNNFEIYRTAGMCCDEHFRGNADCEAESKNPHMRTVGSELHLRDDGPHSADPNPWPIHFPGTENHRPWAPLEAENHWGTENSHINRWFPDSHNKMNCVYGRNYENWYQDEGFIEFYLFRDAEDCCEAWYPARGSSCPDAQYAVNPEAEDEPWHSSAYPIRNYYFPDFSENNCGYGWDYPAWMGSSAYEKSYLFQRGVECCDRFFPGKGGCPFEDTQQLDYYWTSYQENIDNLDDMPIKHNHTYWPDLHSKSCVNGTNYPDWMVSDVDFERMYLFKTLDGCCNHWFTEVGLEGCMNTVIEGYYDLEPCPLNRPECNHVANKLLDLSMWYPDLDGYKCQADGNIPSWMLAEDYKDWYLFSSKETCCAAFGFC